jgi:hypothetical protein
MAEQRCNDIALIEIVRHLESANFNDTATETINRQIAGRAESYPCKLGSRARLLAQEWELPAMLAKSYRLFRMTVAAVISLFAVLGALGALQAFPETREPVNFFWLLMVLLGVHLLTLLFWMTGLLVAGGRAERGAGNHWFRSLIKLPGLLSPGADHRQRTVTAAWLQVNMHGWPGIWRLSQVSHGCWLAYLTGGFVMIIVMLAARQYDFVWETTILSDSAFHALTRWLSGGPQLAGFAVPSAEAVRLSRSGMPLEAVQIHRENWAGLLIGSLLLYGILMRLICLGLARLLTVQAEKKVALDLSQPYYVWLRQDLDSPTVDLGIVDEDEQPQPNQSVSRHAASVRHPPQDALWLGLELGDPRAWPPLPLPVGQDLGLVDDRASQQRLKQQLTTRNRTSIVIVVELRRTPDRGLARFVDDLHKADPEASLWLALLEHTSQESRQAEFRDKLVGWYQLAATCHIADEQVIILQAATGHNS